MAVEEGQSLISLILRSRQPPVLDREQLRRAAAASRAHSNYRERVIFDGATSLDPQDEANLYEDLHEYLRLNVRKRDKEHLIDLVFQVRPSKARQSTKADQETGRHIGTTQGHHHDLLHAAGDRLQSCQYRRLYQRPTGFCR